MGGETRRVRHRHPGSAECPLEGATEVTMTRETGTAALRVFDPEPLHRRRVLLRLGARHRRGYEPILSRDAWRSGRRSRWTAPPAARQVVPRSLRSLVETAPDPARSPAATAASAGKLWRSDERSLRSRPRGRGWAGDP